MTHPTFAEMVAKTTAPTKINIEASGELPVRSGRESIPDGVVTVSGLLAEFGLLAPELSPQWYDVLEYLAKWNADFSYAVDNIVQLGHTPHDIFFDDSVSEEQGKLMVQHLKIRSRQWYSYSGGLESAIGDLFAQTAVNGCLSAEMVVANGLKGLEKIVTVSPKHIRFKYDVDKDNYNPYQVIPTGIVGVPSDGNTKALNPVTYKYIAGRRYSEKPYAVPPFLSALEQIQLERFMVDGMKNIIKRFGVMGFMSVLINAPAKLPSETEAAYQTRCSSYISQIIPEMEKGLSKGYIAGFKDLHEFELAKVDTNVEGAEKLFEINDIKKMAGFKQDPLMFGRNFNTTETLGRVILAKMTSQVGNYQLVLKTFLQDVYYTELALAGFNLKYVEVDFEAPMIGDEAREEEAFSKKIDNAVKLFNEGIIDQTQKAQYLGYDKAAQPEPIQRKSPIMAEDKEDDDTPKKDKKKPTDGGGSSSNSREAEYIALSGNTPEYEYSFDCGCSHDAALASFAKGSSDDEIEAFISKYYKATKGNFDAATKKITLEIAEKLSKFGQGAQVSEVTDSVLATLYKGWRVHFTPTQRKIVEKWVKASYDSFRTDRTVIPNKDLKPVFSAVDNRTIDYYKTSDRLYLGKFITDDDLKVQITKYIKESYIENRAPIGDSDEEIAKFKKQFGDIMQGQDWKLVRIISTTVNKMRNTAAVSYMSQAEVEEYEIRGVNDRLQCAYCSFMQGKRFSVSKAMKHFDELSKSDPELVRFDSPFITSLYKPDQLEGLTAEVLQSQGVHAPSFHPSCRDVAVAVL